MRTKQRKTILVILHLLRRDIPAPDRMALRAIRTHLAAMNIRVAVSAVLAGVGEYDALNTHRVKY